MQCSNLLRIQYGQPSEQGIQRYRQLARRKSCRRIPQANLRASQIIPEALF
jgi:hypothetical protein